MTWTRNPINWYAALQIRAVGEDGARLIMHAVGVVHGDPITRATKKYYAHGPRGVTDWHGTEEGAMAAYEALGE